MKFLNQIQACLTHEDHTSLSQMFPYAEAMKSCVQDPIHHAEGDVWRHTIMVLSHIRTHSLLMAGVYHDVAKPQTRTLVQDEDRVKVSHPRHSRLGAQIFWKDAHEQSWATVAERLHTYWLIRHHQRIFHVWKSAHMEQDVLKIAVDVNPHDLVEFAQADNAGRICDNQFETHADLCLLEEYLMEIQAANRFTSNITKLFYFEKTHRSPDYKPPTPEGSPVYVMSGLPGSGKDYWLKQHMPHVPVVSLDEIRRILGVAPDDNQGVVIQAGLALAREYLRVKTPFAWNSTNLTQQTRQKVIQLCRDYDAHVTVVNMMTDWKTSQDRNQARPSPVPQPVIDRMLAKWEPTSHTEAHNIAWVTS